MIGCLQPSASKRLLRDEVNPGTEYYSPFPSTLVQSGQNPVSRSPATQITNSQERLNTQFLQNFYVEPPSLIVSSWTLTGHWEADQRNIDTQDLQYLPDGSVMPRLRAGQPMDRSNSSSSLHIRYEGQFLTGFIPPVNHFQQYRYWMQFISYHRDAIVHFKMAAEFY